MLSVKIHSFAILFLSSLTAVFCAATAISAAGQATSQGTPQLQPYNTGSKRAGWRAAWLEGHQRHGNRDYHDRA